MNATASNEELQALLEALGEDFSMTSKIGSDNFSVLIESCFKANFNKLESKDLVVPLNGFKIEAKLGLTL